MANAIASSSSVALALEFFLVEGCETGDNSGITKGC